MKRILFVDDEQRVLSGLRRQLHARRALWEMRFVDSGPAALAELARAVAAGTPYDIVVSDMRMPGMDGAQLLERVSEEFPFIGRLVLSGHADPDRMQLARSCAHRYLQKPCPPETLEGEVLNALEVREALDRLGWEAACSVWALPPKRFEHCASVFSALASEADSDDVVTGLLASFSHDAAFWGRLEQVLGAAFPAQFRPGASPAAATAAVGTRNMLALVMARRFAEAFSGAPENASLETDLVVARHIAAIGALEHSGHEVIVQAVTASMLRLPLPPASTPAPATTPAPTGTPAAPATPSPSAIEADRALVLGWLLPTWGFRDAVVTAAACRHAPALSATGSSAALVLLTGADLLMAWPDPSSPPDPAFTAPRMAWLNERGWVDPQARWAPAAAAAISLT